MIDISFYRMIVEVWLIGINDVQIGIVYYFLKKFV